MGVKVYVDMQGVEKKLSSKNMTKGRRALANQAHGDMDKLVPYETHALRMSSSIALDGSKIFYNTPYARPQFYGRSKNASWSKGKKPGTGPRWDLKAKARYMGAWEKAFVEGANL